MKRGIKRERAKRKNNFSKIKITITIVIILILMLLAFIFIKNAITGYDVLNPVTEPSGESFWDKFMNAITPPTEEPMINPPPPTLASECSTDADCPPERPVCYGGHCGTSPPPTVPPTPTECPCANPSECIQTEAGWECLIEPPITPPVDEPESLIVPPTPTECPCALPEECVMTETGWECLDEPTDWSDDRKEEIFEEENLECIPPDCGKEGTICFWWDFFELFC